MAKWGRMQAMNSRRYGMADEVGGFPGNADILSASPWREKGMSESALLSRFMGMVGETPTLLDHAAARLSALTTVTAVFLCARCLAVVVADPGGLAAAQALAANPSYNSVGWVEINEGSSNYRGTGVLVAPDWVLTAAHNWDAGAVTGLEFHIAANTDTAIAGGWLQNPGWSASPAVDYNQGSDIALIHLSAPVPGIAPAALYSGTGELGGTDHLGRCRVGWHRRHRSASESDTPALRHHQRDRPGDHQWRIVGGFVRHRLRRWLRIAQHAGGVGDLRHPGASGCACRQVNISAWVGGAARLEFEVLR